MPRFSIGALLIIVLVLGACAPTTDGVETETLSASGDDSIALAERLVEIETIRSAAREERVLAPRPPRMVTTGSWTVDSLSEVLAGVADGFTIDYRFDGAALTSHGERPSVVIELVDEQGRSEPLSLFVRPGTRRVIIRPEVWRIDAETLHLRSEIEGFEFVAIAPVVKPPDPLEPIPIEMSELLYYPASSWRRDEFELFSWSLYPKILWIDSRDYTVQAAMFKRMAYFIEKRGVIGTLLSDEELAGRHGWNGHNYRGEGLAAFFNAVEEQSFPINELERGVREIAAEYGIISRADDGAWVAGPGGILVISRQSYPELRRLLLSHEAMHGVFYEEPAFREAVVGYWNSELTEREREYWRSFFGWAGYSPDDEYLMINEFQAYLLQQDESAVGWYFRTRIADRLRGSRSVGAATVDAFLADYPRTFVDAAAAMNQALFRTAGMVGGDPFCLRPIGTEG